jgi:hypothetical protein
MTTIVIGKLRDVWMNKNEPVLVIDHPRVGAKIIREHLNVRQRDLVSAASLGSIRIGDMVAIKGIPSSYFDNGKEKACLKEITSIKRI